MTRPKKGKSETSTGSQPPYWFEARVPARFDIALLKPRSLPSGERFEAVADVEERSHVLELALRRSPHRVYRDLAEILSDCRNGYYICGRPFCPICARQYRHWFIAEVLRHAAKFRPSACDFAGMIPVSPLRRRISTRSFIARNNSAAIRMKAIFGVRDFFKSISANKERRR